MMIVLAWMALVTAMLPAFLFMRNLPAFLLNWKEESIQDPDSPPLEPSAKVSVLIPARDEECGIEQCVRHALASSHVDIEVIVLDDQSSDRTAEIVSKIADETNHLRLISNDHLPMDWNGKQYACHQLAKAASHENLLFLDADVKLHPQGIFRLLQYRDQNQVDLLSAFPRQVTGTTLERWIIPMMHLILLGYLPFSRMRRSSDPAYAAGCGQIFLTHQTAYRKSGGHQAIQSSRHDGIKLPRSFRQQGYRTDVIDGTDLASCRMYVGASGVINGVLKNAHEGLANPRLIGLFTFLLLGCTVLPLATLVSGLTHSNLQVITVSILALLLAHYPRAAAVIHFKQSWRAIPFHIPAVFAFVFLQWVAFFSHLAGHSYSWRGRT